MRITDVQAFPIYIDHGNDGAGGMAEDVDSFGDYYISRHQWTSIYSRRHETTVVRISTDDGLIGYGEAQAPVSPRTVATIIEDLTRPVLMGRDPFDVEYLWYRLFSAMRERGHPTGFYIDALAGVDIALWDIIGKAVGRPVHRLLGGRFRDPIPVYAGLGGTDPAAVADAAARHVENGYRALKLHLRQDRRRIVEIVQAVRDSVGTEIDLMVDVHTVFDVSGAITLGRDLERLNVAWLESPIVPEDIGGQAEIARALDMPVAIGEWSRTRFEMREAFQRRAFDIAMPDIGRTGLTEGKKIASLADTYNIPVAPHIGGGGILSVAASIQFSAAIPNFMILEHSHDAYDVKRRIAITSPEIIGGAFRLPDAPGMGVEVDEDALREFSRAR